jgi:hypothetical protein
MIYDYSIDQKLEKSFVGWFLKPTTNAWSNQDFLRADLSDFIDFSGNPKYLKISLVSYPLGSQLEYEMNVKQNGAPITTRNISYSSVSKTYITDFDALVPLSLTSSTNVFDLEIRARKLAFPALTFPSLEFSRDNYLPYLVVVSLWELTPNGPRPMLDSNPFLSGNDSCLDAPFTYAVAKSDAPVEGKLASDGSATAAGCGTIDPPDDNGPGASLMIMMTGFVFTLLAATFNKSRKKFLS